MNHTKFRREQTGRLVFFTLLYTGMYAVIFTAIYVWIRHGMTAPVRDLTYLTLASVLAFLYIVLRMVKRRRHRCPTCREVGWLHGWIYFREYERVPAPSYGKYHPNAFQCNYDLRCWECGRGYQKKQPDFKIFYDKPQELIPV